MKNIFKISLLVVLALYFTACANNQAVDQAPQGNSILGQWSLTTKICNGQSISLDTKYRLNIYATQFESLVLNGETWSILSQGSIAQVNTILGENFLINKNSLEIKDGYGCEFYYIKLEK